MTDAVVRFEILQSGRGIRLQALRWAYAGWLLLQLAAFLISYYAEQRYNFTKGSYQTGVAAEEFVDRLVSQQLTLLILVTPAFAAGAITDEKTRGTLQYLLTTDLTPFEIVFGKLLSRTAQSAWLSLTPLPLICLIGPFGGLRPEFVLGLAAVTLLELFGIGALALLISVWSRQTRDAVIATYFVVLAGMFGLSVVGDRFPYLNPVWVLKPAWGKDEISEAGMMVRLLQAALAWGGLGVACLFVASWRLIPAHIRQLENAGRVRVRLFRPRHGPVRDDPVRWKEYQVEGVAPLPLFRRVPRALAVVCIFLGIGGLSFWNAFDWSATVVGSGPLTGQARTYMIAQAAVVMQLAILLVAARASGCVTGERDRQTWEALLLTPLSATQLVRSKLWGILQAASPYLFAYFLAALPFAILIGPECAISLLVQFVATYMAMYYVGAAGIACSVRSKSAWRSLLATIGISYASATVLFCAAYPVILIVVLVFALFAQLLQNQAGVGPPGGAGFTAIMTVVVTIVLIAGFLLLGWYFLRDARRYIADRERTRYWEEDDRPRRRRRRKEETAG